MTPARDTRDTRPRAAAQAAVLAKLRDRGLGLAPVMQAGRIVAPKRQNTMPARRAGAGAPVADLSHAGPITRPAPFRPADRPTGRRPDPVPLQLVAEFPIDLTRLPEWQETRISANDHSYGHFEKSRRTKLWRKAGKLAAAGWDAEPLPWARLVVWYTFPDSIRREVANMQPTTKGIVDGLVDAGVLVDDRDEFVDGPDNRREWPNGQHAVVVQVWTP
ncbi:RusA-like resolvase [Arthrobacter phage Hirko]|nr:RusA-like resolvase [Arthrobacter phage Hirko]